MTVEAALTAYEHHLVRKGNRPTSIATTLHRLRSILDEDEPVVVIDKRRARQLYDQLADRVAVDTHRNTLNQARTFWRWLIRAGHLKANPWLEVEGIGRRARGKAQLTIDEARTLHAYCVGRTDRGAVGAMLALLCDLRASEICRLTPRDIDAGGTVLRVPGTKSAAAVRTLALPPELDGPLRVALPLGCKRDQLLRAVKATCKAAGVPPVTLHGLRGTHSTIATEIGMSPTEVARCMGHASPTVTERHYIAPGTTQRARQKAALQVLSGGALDSRVGNSPSENCSQDENTGSEAIGAGAKSPVASRR